MSEKDLAESFVKRMEETLSDHIKKTLSDRTEAQLTAHFKETNQRLDSLDKLMHVLIEWMSEDRKDEGQQKIMLATIEQACKELVEMTAQQTKTIVRQVTVELEKVPDKVGETIPVPSAKVVEKGFQRFFEKYKPKVIHVKTQTRPMWKRLLGRK